MNKIKVLSPVSSFGTVKYNLNDKKILFINPVLEKFLAGVDISPTAFVESIKTTVVQESAHVSIEGTEFLINTDSKGEIYSIFTHQIQSLSKSSPSTAATLPMDELHKQRLLTLGEMTAGIVHDINNPLNIVNSGVELLGFFVEALEDEGVKSKELDKIKDQISKIRVGAHRITEVSEGVRMLMHKNQLTFKEQDITKIINSSASCCISFLRENGIEFSLKVKDSVKGAKVWCKESLLAQVFINLIKNSNDAIKNLAPHNKYIEFEVSDSPTHIIIKVKDGGKGIPAEIRSKIFEPFFTTKPIGEGTGIGLSLCRQIIEVHEGWLDVDQTSPNTTFVIGLSKKVRT